MPSPQSDVDLRVIAFAYAPLDLVTVTHLGLNFKGRVVRCIWIASDRCGYDVEYNADGELKFREFYEDEIESRSK